VQLHLGSSLAEKGSAFVPFPGRLRDAGFSSTWQRWGQAFKVLWDTAVPADMDACNNICVVALPSFTCHMTQQSNPWLMFELRHCDTVHTHLPVPCVQVQLWTRAFGGGMRTQWLQLIYWLPDGRQCVLLKLQHMMLSSLSWNCVNFD
jgi:hypothetical protein